MKRKYLIILVVLFVAGVGFLALRGDGGSRNAPQDTPIAESEEKVEENTVIYADSGFSPNSLNVKIGTTVKFINESNRQMWVASDPHPVHTDYSSFDQLSDGDEYSFTFTEAGSYPYHNHLVPTDTGIVTVE